MREIMRLTGDLGFFLRLDNGLVPDARTLPS